MENWYRNGLDVGILIYLGLGFLRGLAGGLLPIGASFVATLAAFGLAGALAPPLVHWADEVYRLNASLAAALAALSTLRPALAAGGGTLPATLPIPSSLRERLDALVGAGVESVPAGSFGGGSLEGRVYEAWAALILTSVAFFVIFYVAKSIGDLLARLVALPLPGIPGLSLLNRLGAGALGAVQHLVVATAVLGSLAPLTVLPFLAWLTGWLDGSLWASELTRLYARIAPRLAEWVAGWPLL